jgi:preprotein translocase subunit SecE
MSTVENVKAPARTGSSEGGRGITAWWTNSRTFLSEVRNEMKRVTWPSRREVYATTVVVIVTSAFFGLYLCGLDLALTWAVNWVFQQFGAA